MTCEGAPFGSLISLLPYLVLTGLALYIVPIPRNRLTYIEFEKWRNRLARRSPNLVSLVPGMTNEEKLRAIQNTPFPRSVSLAIGDEALLSASKCCFDHVRIESAANIKGPLRLSGTTIGKLEVKNIGELHFEKCKLGELSVIGANPKYWITSCLVGMFVVQEKSPIQRLEWNKGYLGQFDLRGWPRENPFVGDVSIRRVEFSNDPRKYDSQWARDTRSALSKVDNAVAAGLFHGHALRLNRTKERWPSKLVDTFYKYGCDYGNSIGLPAFWFALAFVAIFFLAFAVDTHVDAAESEASLRWQRQLSEFTCKAKVLRALTYAFQSINPLNLITSKPTVFLSEWWAAYLSAFGGLCAAVAFGLFLVSVRRRFKLE